MGQRDREAHHSAKLRHEGAGWRSGINAWPGKRYPPEPRPLAAVRPDLGKHVNAAL